MSRKDLLNRQKILYQQLQMMTLLFQEEFLEILGRKGYDERIDQILDELIFIKIALDELDKLLNFPSN